MFGIFKPMPACYGLALLRAESLPDRFVAVCGPRSAPYEPEHSERQVAGSVTAGRARWLATLAVPMTGDQSILLSLEREGPLPPGAPLVQDVALVIPPGEVDAVLALFRGIVGQARRDGVLPKPSYASTSSATRNPASAITRRSAS